MKRDLGALWHLLAGAAIGALVAGAGILREWIQHRGSRLREWSRHRRAEAAAWGFGAALAALGLAAWIWLLG